MVNVANKFSADSGRRIAAKHLQLAQAGAPVGGNRPFGWQVDKRTINEEEAALIRQAARDVIAGVEIHTIVRQWNRAGVRTTKNNLWQHQVMVTWRRVTRAHPELASRADAGAWAQNDINPAGRKLSASWRNRLSRGAGRDDGHT
jgi:hypothetical protein